MKKQDTVSFLYILISSIKIRRASFGKGVIMSGAFLLYFLDLQSAKDLKSTGTSKKNYQSPLTARSDSIKAPRVGLA